MCRYSAGVTSPLYTRDILRLAASIPHRAQLDAPDGEAELRSPTCGSTIRVAVRLEDGRVAALSQQVVACAFGQASVALMGAHAIGRSPVEVEQALAEISDWLAGRRDDPGMWPGLAALAPARSKTGRHGAILLPFRALSAAIGKASLGSSRSS